MFACNNVFDTITPLHIYSRIVGLAPYSLKIKNGKIVSLPDRILILFRVVGITAISRLLDISSWGIEDGKNYGVILIFMFHLLQLSNMIICDLHIITAHFHRRNMVQVLESLLDLDKIFEDLKIKVPHKKEKVLTTVFVLTHVFKLFTLAAWMLSINHISNEHYLDGLNVIFITIGSSMHVEYTIFLMIITNRFRLLNDQKRSLIIESSQMCESRFVRLKHIYFKLIGISRSVNYTFQQQILLRFTTLYITLNYGSFYIFKNVNVEDLQFTGFRTYLLLSDVMEVITISAASGIITDQVTFYCSH